MISVRFPWELANWTMPLLEVIIIGGAVFALIHAIRRHRAGDPTNLALWFASLVYLLVIEPPLYFPEWFGLDQLYGFIFAHNRFTVQFMWDRLPLYIVAFYPAFSQLAYELVRSLGIFARRGALIGSVAVAFTCQVFYEVFDHIGPQLKWWAWNMDNDIVNQPTLASVPMNSMLLFASVSMGAMTYLVVRLASRWSLVPSVVVAGVLTPLTMTIAGIPSGFFKGNSTAQAWVLGVELALLWLRGHLDRCVLPTVHRPRPGRVDLRAVLPSRLPRWDGGDLAQRTPGLLRRGQRRHQRRHADWQRALRARLLRRCRPAAHRAAPAHRPGHRLT